MLSELMVVAYVRAKMRWFHRRIFLAMSPTLSTILFQQRYSLTFSAFLFLTSFVFVVFFFYFIIFFLSYSLLRYAKSKSCLSLLFLHELIAKHRQMQWTICWIVKSAYIFVMRIILILISFRFFLCTVHKRSQSLTVVYWCKNNKRK